MKTPIGSIALNQAALIRTVTGAPVAADTTPYTFDPTTVAIGAGWRSVLVWAVTTGPAHTETVDVKLVARAGSAWSEVQGATGLIDATVCAVIDVMGRDFTLAITAVTGLPTQVDFYAAGWEPLRYDGQRVG